MNTNKQLKNQIFRDGVSQRDRLLRALEPDYVAVDERNLSDLLAFVQEYATKLNYYDESNSKNGDWSRFFVGDVKQMVAYINNPESFADDESALRRLSQPHLVLLFVFLQLLHYPQQQFKALTQRYLDFYYKEVLKLTTKEGVPDKVNVIFELAQGEETHLIKQGTLLNAGQDSQGINLNYATDEDLIVNQAQVASVKTLFLEKIYISLENIHNQDNQSDKSFENMLRWAVGRPNQGNELPYFQGKPVDISNLKNFDKEEPKDSETERKNYILKEIFFATIEDFKYCFEIHDREKTKGSSDVKEPTELEWKKVYKIIEKAYKKKITWERRNTLKEEREQSGFESMVELALGHPNPGDPLPEMPNNYTKLIDIFNNITQESVVRYIKEELYLSLEDFRKIMEIQTTTENSKEQKWEEVYRLVEKAQTKKRNFTYPPIGRTEIKNIHASSIVDEKEGQATISQRFPTFGNITTSQNYSIGFAIASPILSLKEGVGNITITLSCHKNTLNINSINELINREKIPFEIYLSSEKEWIKVESSVFAVGDFIVEQELQSYDNPPSLDPSSLICTSVADTFVESDRDRYLVFEDGKIYQIAQYISATQVQLSPVGQLSSSHDTVKQYSVSGIYFNT